MQFYLMFFIAERDPGPTDWLGERDSPEFCHLLWSPSFESAITMTEVELGDGPSNS